MDKVSQPFVAIIITNWNGKEDTVRCIDSIVNSYYSNYSIIVIDNGSTDGSQQLLRKRYSGDKKFTLIENGKNIGLAAASNIGIRQAIETGAEYVLVLNNDTVLKEDTLSQLLKVAETDKRIAVVGPKVYYLEDPSRLYSAVDRVNLWYMSALPTTGGELDSGQYTEVMDVDSVVGCALLVRIKAIKEVGLYDDEFFYYYEEVDWLFRMRKHGFRVIFAPNAVMYHKGAAITPSPRMAYFKMRNLILFMRKNAKPYHWLSFAPILTVIFIQRIIWALLKRDFKTCWSLCRAIGWHLVHCNVNFARVRDRFY